MRRVAVTGIGVVSALGPDAASFCDGLRAGRSGIAPPTLFDTAGFRAQLAAQAPDPAPPLPPALLTTASRPDRFGLQAAFEAVAHAGLDAQELADAAVIFGTGTGGLMTTEEFVRADGGDPSLLVPHQPASVTDLVARHLGIGGPRSTIMTACSSSATAIGYAADRIRLGHADVALAGGAEGLTRLTFAGFGCLRATAPGDEPCRPFDAERKGLTLGEGAAVLVLEELSRARARRDGAGDRRRLGHDRRRAPHDGAASRGRRRGARDAGGARRRATCSGRDRLRQRARHWHAAQRRRRDAGVEARLRRARRRCRCRASSRWWVTRSARRGRSKRPRRCCR
jgi:hypothetical protein